MAIWEINESDCVDLQILYIKSQVGYTTDLWSAKISKKKIFVCLFLFLNWIYQNAMYNIEVKHGNEYALVS